MGDLLRVYLHVIWWASLSYVYCIWGCRPSVLMAGRPLSPPHLQLSISDLFTWSPKRLSWKISLQRVSDREGFPPSLLLVNLIYLIYLLTCNAGGRGRSWTYVSRYLWAIADLSTLSVATNSRSHGSPGSTRGLDARNHRRHRCANDARRFGEAGGFEGYHSC